MACHGMVFTNTMRSLAQANPCVKVGSKATMGYKGITTEYLPRTTVPIKTVEIPGCR
jgi:hypothetical protein